MLGISLLTEYLFAIKDELCSNFLLSKLGG
jgi:hypothetical protein